MSGSLYLVTTTQIGQDVLAHSKERVMPETDPQDFEAMAAAILAHSKATRADAMMMADVGLGGSDNDDDDQDDDEDQNDSSGGSGGSGSGSDDQDDDDENDDDQDDEDSKPAVKEDGSPVTLKDWNALNESLKASRKAERAAKRAARGKGTTNTAEADKAAEAKYKPILVKQAARGALVEAGLIVAKGKEQTAISKALKLIDMDEIELDEDGEVEGLTEQIQELKESFPELFVRRGGRRIAGEERGRAPGKSESSADTLAGLIGGGS